MDKNDEPQDSYFLVLLKDDAEEAPQVHRCDSEKDFAALVNEHVLGAKQPLYAFAFIGERIQISAPSAICTVDIGGEKLNVGEQSTRFEETGRIIPLKTTDK
jgi:hypothetical protein